MDNNEFEKEQENDQIDNTALNDNSDANEITADVDEETSSFNDNMNTDSQQCLGAEDINNVNASAEKTVSFYSESYKKPNKNKGYGLAQLIAVALICSLLGGGIAAAIFTFVPINKSDKDTVSSNVVSDNGAKAYKKVEIEKTNSPVEAIAQKVGQSIVGIKVNFAPSSSKYNFFLGSQGGVGEGSGIIVKSDGYIVTNNHVVEEAVDSATGKLNESSKIEVILPNNPKKSYQAQLIARDSKSDLAVLKINLTGLPAAELGDSNELKVGELAVAIGSPGGLDYMNSVTAGIISGLNRDVADNGIGMRYIQTDAPINSGNSGGALLNSKGQVIGINTLKADTQSGYEGLGFAIPINQAKTVIDSLINNKYVTGRPPILNLTANTEYTAEIAKANGWPEGVYVDNVTAFGAAYRAGIRDNDIITKFDGERIKSFDDLTKVRNKHKAGDKVKAEIYSISDGKYKTVTIILQADKT